LFAYINYFICIILDAFLILRTVQRQLKCAPNYPGHVASLAKAFEWVEAFIDWYNTKHLHSGIGYITPEQKHSGEADAFIARRNATKLRAYETHTERWSGGMALLSTPQVVYLNPSLETRQKLVSGL
jgi:putative transposase